MPKDLFASFSMQNGTSTTKYLNEVQAKDTNNGFAAKKKKDTNDGWVSIHRTLSIALSQGHVWPIYATILSSYVVPFSVCLML